MRNFVVTIDGKSYSVGVEEVGESKTEGKVASGSTTTSVAAPVKSVSQSGSIEGQKVLSPFPGLIKNLLVSDGASVKKDQPILVLEAMKMDNEITAPCDGKVTISVAKGANVETNALLAVID